VDGLLTADTMPWPDIETFERYRNDFESWRRNKRRCCITTADFCEFEHWRESKTRHQAVGMSGKARRPPLVQMFLRAWSARSHGLPGGQFKVLAEITSRWWPTTPNAIKLAKRHGAPAPVAEISPEERQWLDAVAARWPGIDWFRFIVPSSPAAAFAFAGNLDYWAAHMWIPDPLWEALAGLPAGLRYAAEDGGAEGVVRSSPHRDATTPPARPIDPLAASEKILAYHDLAEGVVQSENAARAYTFRVESRAGDAYKNKDVSHTDPC